MAVCKDEILDFRRIVPCIFDVLNGAIKSKPRAAIDEHRLSEVEKINGAVPRIGHIRSCNAIEHVMYFLGFHW
jgi:hypothetical protein